MLGIFLQEEQDLSDHEQAKLRMYIIKRCKLAAATLFGDPRAEQVLQSLQLCVFSVCNGSTINFNCQPVFQLHSCMILDTFSMASMPVACTCNVAVCGAFHANGMHNRSLMMSGVTLHVTA